MDRRRYIRMIHPRSSRARRYHREVFLPRIKKYLDEVRSTGLTILVWGPRKEPSELASKRVAIVNDLRQMGLNALRSEDLGKSMSGDDFPSEKSKEFLQALAADLIVIIRASPGSIAEMHDFADYKAIASKMVIFVDRATLSGYSAKVAVEELSTICKAVRFFHYPDDIRECKLSAEVKHIAQLEQHRKYRSALKDQTPYDFRRSF